MILSLLDKYPWAPTKTAPVMILTQFSLLYIVWGFFRRMFEERVVAIVAIMSLLIVNLGSWPSSIKSYNTSRNSEKINEIVKLYNNGDPVLVSTGMNPICRHLFEYGALKNMGYPSNFTFLPNDKIIFDDYCWILFNSTADTYFPDEFEKVSQYIGENINYSINR